MSIDASSVSQQITEALDAAAAFRHPRRAMRVTLECGHLRLMPHIDTVMGIGAISGCGICPKENDGGTPGRMVVNVEETGTLHDSWRPTPATSRFDPSAETPPAEDATS